MQYGILPGPAGEEGDIDQSAPSCRSKRVANRFQVHGIEEHLAKGDVLQVLGVTRGIAGEIGLLLNRQGGGTVRASMTRTAVQKVGPRPGDMILLEKDLRPIMSSHYNPMQLICIGSDACVRMGAIKDEEACEGPGDAEEGGVDRGQHSEMSHASLRQPVGQRRAGEESTWDDLLNRNAAEGAFRRPGVGRPQASHGHDPSSALSISPLDKGRRIEDRIDADREAQGELETVLCQETQPVCPRPTATTASAGEQFESRPARTWDSRPEASMNADLYLAFTDSDDEGGDEAVAGGNAGGNAGIPSSNREEPTASVDARKRAQPKFSAPVAPIDGSHCIHPPPSAPVSGAPSPRATVGAPPATAIDVQAEKDEEDDLLAGLDDPF